MLEQAINQAISASLLQKVNIDKEVIQAFDRRVKQGCLTRDENPRSHFCVYFVAYDPDEQKYFLGHHMKSGLWLFTGGHVDAGENLTDAVRREMREEWGDAACNYRIPSPSYISIAAIKNNKKTFCVEHYNIWYFIPVNKSTFFPDQKCLSTEFYETRWLSAREASLLVTDSDTLKVIDMCC